MPYSPLADLDFFANARDNRDAHSRPVGFLEDVRRRNQIAADLEAIALLNTWPGVEIRVPRFPDAHPSGARRWMQIANVIGEIAMQKLASLYGGTMLEIPLCSRARQAKRNRIICRDFDHLTGKPPEGIGLSKTEAVQEIGMRYAPISARQIESILNR